MHVHFYNITVIGVIVLTEVAVTQPIRSLHVILKSLTRLQTDLVMIRCVQPKIDSVKIPHKTIIICNGAREPNIKYNALQEIQGNGYSGYLSVKQLIPVFGMKSVISQDFWPRSQKSEEAKIDVLACIYKRTRKGSSF